MRDDNVSIRRVNSEYLLELNRFCDTDKDITNCRKKLHQEVFRHDWFVALFQAEVPFLALPLFNKPFFKEALRQFYIKAHDAITRFGFFGYYYLRDIDAWVEDISKPRVFNTRVEGDVVDDYGDEEEEEEEEVMEDLEMMLRENVLENFPFGVIPVGNESSYNYGQYVVVEDRATMRRTVAFICNDDEERSLSERYYFNVMDRGAQFVPMAYTDMNGIGILATREDIVPVSPFADLYRQKQLIREGETTLFDANSLNVYPESLIIDNTPKDAVLDDVADEHLYSIDNLLCVKQTDNQHREAMGMENTRYQRDRLAMKRTVAATRGRCGSQLASKASTVIWDHKLDNNRPSAFEAMKAIPRSVTVVGGKIGQPVVNVDKRIQKYEEDVCNVMNVPLTFFKPHSALQDVGGPGSNKSNRTTSVGKTSHNDVFQKALEKEVREQHALFDELFREMYSLTFSKLDARIFSPYVFRGLVPGIRFDHKLVMSEEALLNLAEFAKVGLLPMEEVSRLVHKNFNIPFYGDDEEEEPLFVPASKRRRIEEPLLFPVKKSEEDGTDEY